MSRREQDCRAFSAVEDPAKSAVDVIRPVTHISLCETRVICLAGRPFNWRRRQYARQRVYLINPVCRLPGTAVAYFPFDRGFRSGFPRTVWPRLRPGRRSSSAKTPRSLYLFSPAEIYQSLTCQGRHILSVFFFSCAFLKQSVGNNVLSMICVHSPMMTVAAVVHLDLLLINI